jgi:hypothetical protein
MGKIMVGIIWIENHLFILLANIVIFLTFLLIASYSHFFAILNHLRGLFSHLFSV